MGMRITFRPGGTALCPLCKEPLSREARKCPHCQSDLTENAAWNEIQNRKGGCTLLILAGCFLILSTYALAEAPPLFQQIQPGDSIHISYTSRGCFHSTTYEFEIQRTTAVTARITEVEHAPAEKGKDSGEEVRTPLGTLTLTGSDLTGLDRLFEYYRKKERGACTTEDRIKATYKSTGVTKNTEFFTDSTCNAETVPHVMLLPSLAVKLKKHP